MESAPNSSMGRPRAGDKPYQMVYVKIHVANFRTYGVKYGEDKGADASEGRDGRQEPRRRYMEAD
jgi:hypothetical protein